MLNPPYLVSVRLMVFNHAPFVRQAIESILKQETDFLVEVVIGDDFSTDESMSIIRELESTEKIHLKILDRQIHDDYWQKRQQLGRLYNFTNILENCSGKYVAFLDGDDYWTDTKKLQQQVNFLESHPDHFISCHNVATLYSNGTLKTNNTAIAQEQKTYTINDLAAGTVDINTPTVLCKNQFDQVPFSLFFTLPIGDYPLWLFLSAKGLIHYSPLEMAVYRVHDHGVWSSKKTYQRYLTTINTIEKILDNFDPEVQLLLNRQVVQLHKKALKSTFNAVEDCEKMLDIFYQFDKKALAECIMDEVKQKRNVVATRKRFRQKMVAFIKRIL